MTPTLKMKALRFGADKTSFAVIQTDNTTLS